MTIRTFGNAFESLRVPLEKAAAHVHNNYLGSKQYFPQMYLAIHHAFDKWCSDVGIEREKRGMVRSHLHETYKHYPQFRRQCFDDLFNKLPPEFNVRGEWVSSEAQINLIY